MPAIESTSAVIIEPDEETIKELEVCQDASVIQMANELLALSGKGPLPTLTHFRPLHRPRTFTPSKSHLSFEEQHKKRDCMAAISDDEDDIRAAAKRARREMTNPTLTQNWAVGGHPTNNIPLGRPLMAPPRLPCLPPGQALPAPWTNKSF